MKKTKETPAAPPGPAAMRKPLRLSMRLSSLDELFLLMSEEERRSFFYEWQDSPITQMMLGCLQELSEGKPPAVGLVLHDYAHANGVTEGLQKAVAIMKNPSLLLDDPSIVARRLQSTLGEPTYSKPEAQGTIAAIPPTPAS